MVGTSDVHDRMLMVTTKWTVEGIWRRNRLQPSTDENECDNLSEYRKSDPGPNLALVAGARSRILDLSGEHSARTKTA